VRYWAGIEAEIFLYRESGAMDGAVTMLSTKGGEVEFCEAKLRCLNLARKPD
jgi:hypothetical protein